jgi:hypothetical protein
VNSDRIAMMDFDYVISAPEPSAVVLANRLSEHPDNRVLLLEYGGGNTNPGAPGQSERSRMTSGCHRY